jgi:hypothetical protein
MPQIESVKFHFIIEIESVKSHFIIDVSIGYLFYYTLAILFLIYLLKDKTESQAEPDTFRWTLYSSSV